MNKILPPFLCLLIGLGIGFGAAQSQLTEREKTVDKSELGDDLPELPLAPDSPGDPAALIPDSGAGFREYPIGETEKNSMRISAVWLPPVIMEGQDPLTGQDVLHLEADVAATRGNPNGFGLGEWVPYLRIRYEIKDSTGKLVKKGPFQPMVAADGPHYGTTLQMPGPGRYKLTYFVEPPSVSGFGRHCDKVTGVADWWSAFQVEYDWDYQRP
ncbi:MAG: iron transporter [Planctomycetota bacterium]|nr:iron transporter [Planctomycetota bacterium]